MSSIYDLSDRELFQLKAVDPHLSGGWEELLFQVLPKLDKDNQLIIKEDILAPRGIHYDHKSQKFYAEKAKTLREVLETGSICNRELLQVAEYMLEIIIPTSDPVSADDLADSVESVLSQLKSVILDDTDKPKIKYEVLKAFLYDLAKWIDTVELVVRPGMRKINADIAKIYLKEVFIKQQIQGWDFRSWDAMDILHLEGIPDWVKDAVEQRKCYMIETDSCWFLIGQAETAEQNPFSFRRFLHEDDGGGLYRAFVNGVAIPRALVDKPEVIKLLQKSIDRIYTLDRTISGAVSKFVREIKEAELKTLRPLLRARLSHDGSDIESAIYKRMIAYEKQLTSSILVKLPKIISDFMQTQDDRNYLFYHLGSVIKSMINAVEDFRLQPATRFSVAAEMMVLKLATYQLLLTKLQEILCDKGLSEEQKTQQTTEPLKVLTDKMEEVSDEYAYLGELYQELLDYQQSEGKRSFFSRLFKREPDYTLADIQQEASGLSESLFMFIVRLEKHKRRLMVYPEFEIYKNFNDNFRHYAFANGIMGINRLPKLLRLPEDRSHFKINSVQQVIYYDVIKGFSEYIASGKN